MGDFKRLRTPELGLQRSLRLDLPGEFLIGEHSFGIFRYFEVPRSSAAGLPVPEDSWRYSGSDVTNL
jgi:hypothetical protein